MSVPTLVVVFALWVALMAGALALSLLTAANDTLPGDRAITEWLQDQSLPAQDPADIVRAATTTGVVLAIGAGVSLILWLKGYRRQAMLLVAGLAALVLVQFAVKEVVDRPRPSAELVDVRAGGGSPSFPAGHVMSGTFLYGFLIYLTFTLPLARSAAIVLAIGAGLLIALGGPVNVWLGVHWPSDVLGGYIWASVILLPIVVLDLWQQHNAYGNFS